MIPLINIRNGTKQLGGKTIFDGLCCSVNDGERLGIIGANGAGKSTLLKIFAGMDELDDGEITRRRGMSMRIIAQQDLFPNGVTIEQVLSETAHQYAPDDAAAVPLALAAARFDDPTALVSSLSGGWRKRLSIVRGMIGTPDLLLLDEPTNHLDIEGIEWLEETLRDYQNSLCFISHDRYFIESCATRVLEIDRHYSGGVFAVDGNYSQFIEKRESYREQREQQQRSLSNRVRREVEWLRQGAKARTTKSKHRTDEALRLVAELKKFDIRSDSARIEFASTGKRTKELLRITDLAVSRGGKAIASDLTLVVTPGQCIGLAGANGSGKSSLLKTFTGELAPDKGSVVRANRLSISVFDQTRESLDLSMTLQEALLGDRPSITFAGTEFVPVAWAKRFLFQPEQLRLPLRSLSGGEQARVLIARLMREPSDVLILDEPTNDLDIPTLEVLESSIESYPGAVLLVTHDRYLLDRCSTSIIGILGDGRSEIFASYLQWEIAREERTTGKGGGSSSVRGEKSSANASATPEATVGGPLPALTYSEKIELNQIEKKILKAENEVRKIEEATAQIALTDREAMTQHYSRLAAAQREVEALYNRWSELEARKNG